jgi:hypothetical protein
MTLDIRAVVDIPSTALSQQEYRDWVVDIETQLTAIPGSTDRHDGDKIGIEVNSTITPGLYVREWCAPADTLCVSRIHLTEHPFFILSGKVSVYDGKCVEVITGPYKGITPAGTKRVVYVNEAVVWVTFHPTDKTTMEDIDKNGEITCDYFSEFDAIANREVTA